MPQIFQVLKCYKCSIFQVHQARKDNKWKCKVCDEKQSVKRHYGIGTAKDCRVHVQKLNCLRGDIEESALNALQTDSSMSDCEKNTDDDELQMKNTQRDNNSNKESKWSAYVDKEEKEPECSAVKESGSICNVEVCLELPQKRKMNRKCKPFKVPKVSYNIHCNKKTEIINEITNKVPVFESEESNSYNSINKPTELLSQKSEINEFDCSENKSNVFDKSAFHQINKISKWAYYVTEEDSKNGIKKEEHIVLPKEDYKPKSDQILIRNNCKKTKTSHKSMMVEPIFSISDDNDLDNILHF